jgi:hypothetical protein
MDEVEVRTGECPKDFVSFFLLSCNLGFMLSGHTAGATGSAGS